MASKNNDTVRDKRVIRFGIMCNGTALLSWQAECLKQLLALGNIQLSLVIMNAGHRQLGFLEKIRRFTIKKFLWSVSLPFIFRPRSYLPVDISHILSKAAVIRCRTQVHRGHAEYFSHNDVEAIRSYDLDFILRFGFNIIRGDILNACRYGIWSFHHDDETKYRGSPPCFWEIYFDDPVTSAVLQRLSERLDCGVILKKGYFRTIDCSYAKNLDRVNFESANWPAKVCMDIFNHTADYLTNQPSESKARIFHNPGNLQMLLFMLKIFRRRAANVFKNLFRHEQWHIGMINCPIQNFLQPGYRPQIEWLPLNKKNTFAADPFGMVYDDKLVILHESFDYRAKKGKISSATVDAGSACFADSIDSPLHLSYPYILRLDGETYCIPEIVQAREIALFKAKNFPSEWEKSTVLIKDFAAVDATIFKFNAYWWIFCCEERNPNTDLFIWYSRDILGRWLSHVCNPVKSDIRSARPAGTPFIHQGCLYRPAQDCSRAYGWRVVLNKVVCLTPNKFEEEQAAVVELNQKEIFSQGIHTLSAAGEMTLVDGKRSIFNKYAFKDSLLQYLRKQVF